MTHPQVAVAFERADQIVERTQRVWSAVEPFDGARDRLPPDDKGCAHFGANRAGSIGIGDHAIQHQADQQHRANQAD
jgi:hypothetical protein